MKTWMRIDVGAWERFVIARYFAAAATTEKEKRRRRATRAQVRRFVEGALQTALKTQADGLRGKSRGAARRLAEGGGATPREPLAPTPEEQRQLIW